MDTHLSEHLSRRFLFSTTGGYGHFHPLVPLARALKQRGHAVAFATRPAFGPQVEAEGLTFFPVGGDLAADLEYQQFKAEQRTMPTGLDTELFTYPRLFCGIAPRLRTPELVEITRDWQADMVVREAGQYSALIAAEHLGLPHATVSFAAALKGMAIFEREAAEYLDPIRRIWGLAPDPTLASPYRYLYLAYTPPGFGTQDVGFYAPWHVDSAQLIPATTHFIRPEFFDSTANERLPDWLARLPGTGQPLVYATLGTEVNSEPGLYPRVLQTIIAGLRDMPTELIVTIGRDKDPKDFGPQPDNVHIERYIPQSLLLPHCDLILMHGGSNTLLQAIDAGLPVVVVPLIADQFFNAHVAQRLRLGDVVRTWHSAQPGQLDLDQLTPDGIRVSVEKVLEDPIYKQNVSRLQAEMYALPGQDYAVRLVEKVVAERKPALNADLTASLSGL